MEALTMLALLLALLVSPARAAGDALQARLVSARGDVFVYYKDAPDDPVPAEADDPLEEGDRVQTGENAYAELSLDGESLLELSPDSDFEIGELARKSPSFTLSLGSVLAKIKSMAESGGEMTLQTPTAVCAVRGTEFGVDVGEDEATSVGVFDEGKVAVSGSGGEQTLAPNQETSVARGAQPAKPAGLMRFKARRARLKRMRGRLQNLRARWRRLDAATHAARRRLMRARANGASPARRARLRRRLRRLRRRRKSVNERRSKVRRRLQDLRKQPK